MANLLEQLAPTIGSVGGGILGGLAGTFIGGPGVGTVAGGIAGAGLGGAAGQAIENAGNKQAAFQGNDITSGLEGAAGQATGEGIAAGAGKLLGGLGGSGVVQDTAATAAKKLLQGQVEAKDIPNSMNPIQVAKTLWDNGITDLRNAPAQLRKLTGPEKATVGGEYGEAQAGGLYNIAKDSVLQDMDHNGIKISGDYSNAAETAINPSTNATANSFNPAGANKAKSFINQTLMDGGLVKEAPGGSRTMSSLPISNLDGTTPSKAAQAMKVLRDAAHNQDSTPNGKATAGAYNAVAKTLSDDVLAHPEATITPEIRRDLIAGLNQTGLKRTNPKLYTNELKFIESEANNLQDLNTHQTGLVEAIKAAESPTKASSGLTPRKIAHIAMPIGGFMAGGPAGLLAGSAADALDTQGGHALLTKIAGGIPSASSKTGTAVGSGASRGVAGAVGAGVSSLLGQGLPGASGNPGGASAMPPTIEQAAGAMNAGGSPVNPAISMPLQLAQIAATTDVGALPGILSSPGVTNALTQENTANKAAALLPALEQQFKNAGGAQGKLLGSLQEFVQKFTGGPAAAYQALASSDAAAIAKALGVTTEEAESLMPQITQTAQAAQTQGQGLTSVLGQLGGGGGVGGASPLQGLQNPTTVPGYQAFAPPTMAALPQ